MNRQKQFTITATMSAGTDGAVVLFVDGEFPTGLRVVVNDNETYGTPFEYIQPDREAHSVEFLVKPSAIEYMP